MSHLRIGDIIAIRHMKPYDGWLAAEGILSEDLILIKESDCFENCLWEVTVQNQYNAVKEYEDKILNIKRDDDDDNFNINTNTNTNTNNNNGHNNNKDNNNLKDHNNTNNNTNNNNKQQELIDAQELYDQFYMASLNEQKLNERLMALKTGKPVVFGDVIQLRHVKTRGFLTVSSNQLAKHEKENMRVEIDASGNSLSWLEFMPRFKYDKEGQQILHENECHIRVHERPSEFIHAARKVSKFSNSGNREINCSLENSVWTISIFQQCWEAKSKNILCGQLVSLQETETSSFLGIESTRGLISDNTLPVSLCPQQLSLTVSDCNVGTNLLWMLEAENQFSGGQVICKEGKYALRDLNTGLYMKLSSDGLVATKKRSDCSFFEFIGGPTTDNHTPLNDNSMVQIINRNQWLCTKKSSNVYKSQGTGTEDRTLALSFIVSSKIQRTLGVDVYVGVEAANLFQKFKSLVKTKQINSMSPGQIENEFKALFSCLDTLSQFLNQPNMQIAEENDLVAVLEPSGAASLVIRQTMLREQGILNTLLDIVEMAALGLLSDLDRNPRLKKLASQTSVTINEYSTHNNLHDLSNEPGSEESLSSEHNHNHNHNGISIGHSNSNKFLDLKHSKLRASFGGSTNQEHLKRLSLAIKKHRDKKNRSNNGNNRHTFADVVMEAVAQKRGSISESINNVPLISKHKSSKSLSQSTLITKSPSNNVNNINNVNNNGIGIGHSNNENDSNFNEKEKDDTSNVSLPKELARCCFNVLFLAIVGNHQSQIHIADYFSLLLNQVREQDVSVACVQEMLRDNLEMLQTKVGENEIKIFLDLLNQTEMNVTIMKLLRSTCTCPHGVDNTQRMVVNALFQREKVSRTNAVTHSSANKWKRKASMKLMRSGSDKDSNPFGFVPISLSESSSNLLKKTRSVLISIKEDPQVRRKETWNLKSIYFPEHNLDVVMGYKLVENGLPSLLLSWQSFPDNNNEDFTMMTLFGCQNEIPFRYLCSYSKATGKSAQSMYIAPKLVESNSNSNLNHLNNNNNNNNHNNNKINNNNGNGNSITNGIMFPIDLVSRRPTISGKKRLHSVLGKNNRKYKKTTSTASEKSLFERKKQIAAYFIAQLYLAADLCLDRNYVSIALLEKVYTYNMLLTILKTKATTNQFKAPVCRMIRSIYIDRDPQTEVKFPRLIKTSADLRGNPMSGFDDSTGRSPYTFGLLQQIISDYLHNDLDITHCDELSAEMMALLLELVRFGYYNTTDQLQDIINPLVNALENHRLMIKKNIIFNQDDEDQDFPDSEQHTFEAIVAAAVAANNARRRRSISQSILSVIQRVGSHDSFLGLNKIAPNSTDNSNNGNNNNYNNNLNNNIEQQNLEEKEIEMNQSGIMLNSSRSSTINSDDLLEYTPLKILRFLESIKFVTFIISLVIIATILSSLEIFSKTKHIEGQGSFDLFVSVVFILELSTRICCYYLSYGKVAQFFSNVLNIIDLSVVILDIVLLSLDTPSLGGAASFTKSLKILRILRLIRVIRAARLLKKITDTTVENHWIMPQRYSIVTESETRTIVGILKILKIILDRIQDRKLNSSFKAYVDWLDLEKSDTPINALEVYENCLEEGIQQGVSIPKEFDVALLDIVMYSDNNLVKEALHLLMIHKSQDRLLREIMSKLQIISDPKVEEKYRELTYSLNGMRKRAESFEIWGQFLTDSDSQEAEELFNIVNTITRILRSYKTYRLIDFKPKNIADIEIQQLLANLGGLEDVMVLQRALMDASLENMDPRIAKILKACNEMVKTFLMQNEVNQNLAFSYFSWFVEHVDDDVGSSQVVRTMLHNNKNLIKQCPRKYITEFIQKIVKNGRNPDYLDLFVGLVDIDDNGDSGITSVRSEIAKHITSVDRSSRILFWCCSRNSKEYEERLNAMAPYTGYDICPNDNDLPIELRYHINLLHLLAGCKLGPKLQGVYPLDDIVIAILDPGTIFNVQYALGTLLIDALDVKIEGIESSESMWTFFEIIVEFIEKSESELPLWLRVTSIHHRYCEQNTKWLYICLQVIIKYFSDFEFANFYDSSSYDTDVTFELTERSEDEVNELIHRLSEALIGLYEKNRDYFETDTATLLSEAIGYVSQLTAENSAIIDNGISNYNNNNDNNIRLKRSKRRSNINGNRTLSDEVQQVYYRRKFDTFLSMISKPGENLHQISVQCFLDIPFIDSIDNNSDVRFEPFILKITNHIRSQIEKGSLTSTLKKEVILPTLWILHTLQHLLLNINDNIKADIYRLAMDTCGMTYLCLDLIAVGIESNVTIEAIKLLTLLLNTTDGNTQIQSNVYLYLSETDSTLFFEQIKGLLELQMLWCQRFGLALGFEENITYTLPDSLIVIKFLSVMCKNNYMNNKTILLNQDGNNRFVNILDVLADFVDVLSRLESPACTKITVSLMETILELLQGPCWESQEYFVLHTDILVALNRIMRSSKSIDMYIHWYNDRERLKEVIIDVLRGFIECLSSDNVVIERVQASIEVNVLHMLILPTQTDEFGLLKELVTLTPLQAKYLVFLKTLNDPSIEIPSNVINCLETKIGSIEIIWNQQIFTHYFHIPQISQELSESSKFKIIEDMNVGSQELKLFSFLQHSKDLYREAMHQYKLKRSGISNIWRIFGILTRAMLVNVIIMNTLLVVYYKERSESLSEHHGDDHTTINDDHNTTHDDHHDDHSDDHSSTTHILTINRILNYFILNSGGSTSSDVGSDYSDIPVSLPHHIEKVLFGLNIIHIIAALITLIVILVMRVPVTFSTYLESGSTKIMAILRCITDPLPFWYLCYVIVTILSIQKNYLFLSILLLDFIVLDSTSRDVLYAVIIPIRQLLSTFIIMVISLYISAAIIFVYYRTDYLHFPNENTGMYESMLLSFTFGIRAPEGLGEAMYETIGTRMILDLGIYFIVVVILRNIFFGIIISTFAELRKKKEDREEHITNRCFICGINRHEYNKHISKGSQNDFSHHRNHVHNMWNYLYFILYILNSKNNSNNMDNNNNNNNNNNDNDNNNNHGDNNNNDGNNGNKNKNLNHENDNTSISNSNNMYMTSVELYIKKCIDGNDISWIPIGLTQSNDFKSTMHNHQNNKHNSNDHDNSNQKNINNHNINGNNGINNSELMIKNNGGDGQNFKDDEKNQQNLLETKLNLILEQFSMMKIPSQQQQQPQPQQPILSGNRKRLAPGISRQNSTEETMNNNHTSNNFNYVHNENVIENITQTKTQQLKFNISNIRNILNLSNQKLSEISSRGQLKSKDSVLSSPTLRSPQVHPINNNINNNNNNNNTLNSISSVNSINSTNSIISLIPSSNETKKPKKLIISGPSINLLSSDHESDRENDDEVHEIGIINDSKKTDKNNDDKNNDSTDSIEIFKTIPQSQSNNSRYINSSNNNHNHNNNTVNRKSSIDSLGGISENSSDSD